MRNKVVSQNILEKVKFIPAMRKIADRMGVDLKDLGDRVRTVTRAKNCYVLEDSRVIVKMKTPQDIPVRDMFNGIDEDHVYLIQIYIKRYNLAAELLLFKSDSGFNTYVDTGNGAKPFTNALYRKLDSKYALWM